MFLNHIIKKLFQNIIDVPETVQNVEFVTFLKKCEKIFLPKG